MYGIARTCYFGVLHDLFLCIQNLEKLAALLRKSQGLCLHCCERENIAPVIWKLTWCSQTILQLSTMVLSISATIGSPGSMLASEAIFRASKDNWSTVRATKFILRDNAWSREERERTKRLRHSARCPGSMCMWIVGQRLRGSVQRWVVL